MKRRTFLKGTGVSLLVPQMESLGQIAQVGSPRRLLTIVNHLSFYHKKPNTNTGKKVKSEGVDLMKAPQSNLLATEFCQINLNI